jgi:hypothetical protein
MSNTVQSSDFARRAPTPNPLCFPSISPRESLDRKPWRLDLAVAAAALRAKRQQWATLKLRQDWADEPFMRAHLKAADITVASDAEPATVERLQRLLTRAGIRPADTRNAIGTTLKDYLVMNPNLPLWAALALVLEAAGAYTSNPSSESLDQDDFPPEI